MGNNWDTRLGVPDQDRVRGEDCDQDSVPVGRHPQRGLGSHLGKLKKARPSNGIIHGETNTNSVALVAAREAS